MVAPLIAGAMVAAPLIAGYMGQLQAARNEKERQKILKQAADEVRNVVPPDPQSQTLAYQELAKAGMSEAELEQVFPELTSAVAGITTDPRLRESRMRALTSLEEQAKTGLTAEDRLAMQELQNRSLAQEKAQRQAILQGMARRGVSGSGMELAAQMEAQQAGANRMSQEQMAIAAQEQQRRLQAMQAAGAMAGSIEEQAFNQDLARAQAQDAIQKFNLANSIEMQRRNIAARNEAAAANLATRQADIKGRMDTQKYNTGLQQQYFSNLLDRTNAANRIQAGLSDIEKDKAAATRKAWETGGTNVGQGLGTWMTYGDRNNTGKKA